MISLLVKGEKYYFDEVLKGIENASCCFTIKSSHAILKWTDELQFKDYFDKLLIWQVTNRIPSAEILTRKVSLAMCINEVLIFFPNEYKFIPKQYILPDEMNKFKKMLKVTKKTWIIKPDQGSLGAGITIVEPQSEIDIPEESAVAQEYIESYTIENKKFDLRVYALVASLNPLRIYVYRDGIARFCAEEQGKDPIFSRITNVGLNRQKESDFKQISRLISDVFEKMRENGINTDVLWQKIDDCIIKTILSSINRLHKAELAKCPPLMYSRCFQIFGFDILLDKNLNPWVLEVNYRPILEGHRGVERRMKTQLITDTIKIAVPLRKIQSILSSRLYSWDEGMWRTFLTGHPELNDAIATERALGESASNYKKVFGPGVEMSAVNQRIYETVVKLPVSYIPGFEVPHLKVKGGEA